MKAEQGAQFFTGFLEQLCYQEQVAPNRYKPPAMPKSAIVSAEGIKFVIRKKLGFGFFSFAKEKGIVLKKQHHLDGSVTWSGPVFTKGFIFSIGFTFGWSVAVFCHALMNDQAICSQVETHHPWGLYLQGLLDMNGSSIRKVTTSSAGKDIILEKLPGGGMYATYYIIEAFLVEACLRFGFESLCDKTNLGLYGSDFTSEKVLSGNYSPPEEMRPLYDVLYEYAPYSKEHIASLARKDRSNRPRKFGRQQQALHSTESADKINQYPPEAGSPPPKAGGYGPTLSA